MTTTDTPFGKSAQKLARNPLGIIALFIVLVYGFAALVVGMGAGLQPLERLPLVWFLVGFPVLVLAVFAWLVSRHHTKLYAPSDFDTDEAFLQANRRQAEIAMAIGAARARWCEISAPATQVLAEHRAVAQLLSHSITPQSLALARQKRVLWVDDQPENICLEQQSLESLGVQTLQVQSSTDALAALRTGSVDLLITDMARQDDLHAGYTLLAEVRKKYPALPVIIYSSSRSEQQLAEARRRGAFGSTNRPEELFQWVLQALQLVDVDMGSTTTD